MTDNESTHIDMSQDLDLNQQHTIYTQTSPQSQPSLPRLPSNSSALTAGSSQIGVEETNVPLPEKTEPKKEKESLEGYKSSHLPVSRISVIIPALIIPFSILGLLTRLGLSSIETFTGQQVFALAWPQFIGCLFMGLFISTRSWIDHGFLWHEDPSSGRQGYWIGPFIYVALSSGLCGSITTFSSWSLGTFIELINTAKVNRHPLQNILSALSELTVTLAMSVTGLQLGTHLGEAFLLFKPTPKFNNTSTSTTQNAQSINSNNTTEPEPLPQPPTHWTMFDIYIIVFAGLLWSGMIVAVVLMPQVNQLTWRHTLFACCFAPPGAILRWYLSRFNGRFKTFPIGTFAVNIGGSAILAAIVCLQHSPHAGGRSALACQVLSGLQDGFCGCLTTISTFAVEIRTLPRRASYIYGVASVVLAQLLMLLILGSFVWTRRSTDTDNNVYQHSLCKMY